MRTRRACAVWPDIANPASYSSIPQASVDIDHERMYVFFMCPKSAQINYGIYISTPSFIWYQLVIVYTHSCKTRPPLHLAKQSHRASRWDIQRLTSHRPISVPRNTIGCISRLWRSLDYRTFKKQNRLQQLEKLFQQEKSTRRIYEGLYMSNTIPNWVHETSTPKAAKQRINANKETVFIFNTFVNSLLRLDLLLIYRGGYVSFVPGYL